MTGDSFEVRCAKCQAQAAVPCNVKKRLQFYTECVGEHSWLCGSCSTCPVCGGSCAGEEKALACAGCGQSLHAACSRQEVLRLAGRGAGEPRSRERRRRASEESAAGALDGEEYLRALCAYLGGSTAEDLGRAAQLGAKLCHWCLRLQKKAPETADLLGPEVPELERATDLAAPSPALRRKVRALRHRLAKPKCKGISKLLLGNKSITPLFSSPYPEEYTASGTIYVCESCLCYFGSRFVFDRHLQKCTERVPPGRLVYKDSEGLHIFEVDGAAQRDYCQNLCLLGKMFLENKTLYYDVEPFYFYVLGASSGEKFSVVGYFSKEVGSAANNLSCIVVLPCYQKKGYGSLLIDASYFLSRREGKVGTPEKPLSTQGLASYRQYWADAVYLYLQRAREGVRGSVCTSVGAISKVTGLVPDDVVIGLEVLGAIRKGSTVLRVGAWRIRSRGLLPGGVVGGGCLHR